MTEPFSGIKPYRVYGKYAPIYHWLGLGLTPPEGLHGHNRPRLTRRYTLDDDDPRAGSVNQALVRMYPANRDSKIMTLLKGQRLDDALWRMIYALMVRGGPIMQFDLVRTITRLVSHDRKIAETEAVRLYRLWDKDARQ